MKKIILLASILVISACSQNNSSTPQPPQDNTEEVFNLDANGIGFFSGSPLEENVSEVYLGNVVQGQKKTLVLTIRNMGTVSTAPLTASISSNFYLTASSCSSKVLPPSGGSCSVTINFSSVNKALQDFTGTLSFGSSSIPVRISVISSAQSGGGGGGGSGGTASIKMYDGPTLIQSPPDYSIGSVSGTAKLSKVITIKNEGTAPTLVSDATLSSSSFYLTSNSCTGKQLLATAPNNQCSVTVNFSGSAKIAGQSYSTTLSFAGQGISLSAGVLAPPPPPAPAPSALVFMDGASNLSQDLFLGSYSSNSTLSKTISVKNVGGSSTSSLSLQLLNNNGGWFTVSNSCNNISLAPNSSCSFSLRVSTSGKSSGDYSVELKMGSTSQVVYFTKDSPSCPVGQHLEGSSCVSDIQSCSISNGQGSRTWNGSSYGSCLVTSCNNHYSNQSNSCVPNQYQFLATKNEGGILTGQIIGYMSETNNSYGQSFPYSGDWIGTFTATAIEGYNFNSWGGDCSTFGSNPVCSILLNGNKSISAAFSIKTYTMTYFLNNGALGSGMTGPGPTVAHGTSVTITTTLHPSTRFVKWNGGPCDQQTNPVCSFIATGDVSMEGQIELIPLECQASEHEENGTCVPNTVACSSQEADLLNANAASKTWNGVDNYGACIVASQSDCKNGFILTGPLCIGSSATAGYSIRPNNISIPSSHKTITFYIGGFTQGDNPELTFSGSLSGAQLDSSGIQSQMVLGGYLYYFTISAEGLPDGVGTITATRDGNTAQSTVTISSSIFGVGGMASNEAQSARPNLMGRVMPYIGVNNVSSSLKYLWEVHEKSLSNQSQTMGFVAWDSKGALALKNEERLIGETGFGSPRVDSQGRIYLVGGVCGDGTANSCNRTLSSGQYYQDHNIIIKRYTSSGAADSSFGTNGYLVIREPDENHSTIAYNSDVVTFDIIDDKLVIGSNSNKVKDLGSSSSSGTIRVPSMYVLNLDGSPDTSFNSSGHKSLYYRECEVYMRVTPPISPCSTETTIRSIKKHNGSYYVFAAVNNKDNSGPNNELGFFSLGITKLSLTGEVDTAYADQGVAIQFMDVQAYPDKILFDGDMFYVNNYRGYIPYTSNDFYMITKHNLSDASLVSSFGQGGKIYPRRIGWEQLALDPLKTYFFDAVVALPNDGGLVFGLGTSDQLLAAGEGTFAEVYEKTVLVKLSASGSLSPWGGSQNMLDLRGYQGLRTFDMTIDGDSIVIAGLQNVRGQRIPTKIHAVGSNQAGVPSLLQNGSYYGIYKIDLLNPLSGSGSPATQQEHMRYSMFCGPYGDFDVSQNACVCDAGYSVYPQGALGTGSAYETYFCVKPGQDLCYSGSTWDGQKCAQEGGSCNNNLMCDPGEDNLSCPSDCTSGSCGNAVCDPNEDSNSCPMDCGPMEYCGDLICNGSEDSNSCSQDCGPTCDNIFDQNECISSNNSCTWQTNYMTNECDQFSDQSSCSMYAECSWSMQDTSSCSQFSDQFTCENWSMFFNANEGSCYWDSFNGTCEGGDLFLYSCSGQFYTEDGGFCYQ